MIKIKQMIQLSLQRMRDDGKCVDFWELVCLLTEVSFFSNRMMEGGDRDGG